MGIKQFIGLGQKIEWSSNSRLPPTIDIGLKALVMYLFVMRIEVFRQAWFRLPYLPFWQWLDQLPPSVFSLPLLAILFTAPIAIYLNFHRQKFALLLGLVVILEVIASKPLYSTSQLFFGSLLVLIGCYRGNDWLFRLQLFLLYGGAAINKTLSVDWWNGHYFQGFALTFSGAYAPWLSTLASSTTLSYVLGPVTIIIEFTLAILVILPKQTKLVLLLGLAFHGGMLILTMGKLSMTYFYLCTVSYLLLLTWTEQDSYSFGHLGRFNVRKTTLAFGFFLLVLIAYLLKLNLLRFIR